MSSPTRWNTIMTKTKDHCFVLWADRFDEVAATVFVAELRQAGLRVKLVGLPGPSFVGVHGLALTPDLTLDEALALAERAACIVLPCDSPAGGRIVHDPRLWELLDLASAQQAPIIAGPALAEILETPGNGAPRGIAAYRRGQNIYRQARRLALQVAVKPKRKAAPRLRLGWRDAKSIA